MILDCHTHRPAPQPEGIISVSPAGFTPMPGQLYSLGLHPWNPEEATDESFALLRGLISSPQVVAAGEAGIDLVRGAPLFRQLLDFRKQVEISEEAGKPLVVHDVKAHQHIVQLRRELKASQPWIIHGFRGKPEVARMLLSASEGIYLSFGEKFNADALRSVARDRILAETDESSLEIEAVIDALSAAAGTDLRETIERNTAAVFRL